MKLHSKRVEKIQNYTRNEWRRCVRTESPTKEETAKLLSQIFRTKLRTNFLYLLEKITLVSGGEDVKITLVSGGEDGFQL